MLEENKDKFAIWAVVLVLGLAVVLPRLVFIIFVAVLVWFLIEIIQWFKKNISNGKPWLHHNKENKNSSHNLV